MKAELAPSSHVLLLQVWKHPQLTEDFSRSALAQLESMGVEVRTGTTVKDVSDRGVTVNKAFIASRTVVWAAGNAAAPIAKGAMALGGVIWGSAAANRGSKLSKVCENLKLGKCFPVTRNEMLSGRPLKIPLFRLASGRKQVDDRLGISFEQLHQHVPFRHVPHRHDFYHVVWVESGSGTFIRDGQRCPVRPGSLIFVPPGQVHTWQWKQTLQGYLLSFEPALLFSQKDRPYRVLHELAQWSTSAKDQGQVNDTVSALLRARFEDLAREFGSNEEFRDDMLRAQVTALLICLHRLCVGRVPIAIQEHFGPLTNRFLSLLEREEGKLHRASHYLSALSVSSRTLVNAVLSETGKSPSAWIRDRTLLEARRLLTYTDLTISEIAYRLNFQNVSYFVRFYRRQAGLSPGAARRQGVKDPRKSEIGLPG